MDLPCGRPSAAQIFCCLAYVVAQIGASWILSRTQLGLAERLMIALLPIAAGAGYIWAMVVDMRRMDELQQRIWLEGIGIAFAGAIVLLFSEPVLKRAGFFVPLTGEKVAGAMLILATLGLVFSARRYR